MLQFSAYTNLAFVLWSNSKSINLPKLCVGVDFSGDPHAGDGRAYVDVFKKAKRSGLKLALHMAEIRNLDHENIELLSLPPDRIGHGTFLHESEVCEDMVKQNR